jgi:hypothetical protein
MSKTCPNCGVNSPDNAKFCIECAQSLEGVPINKEEKPPQKKEENEGSVALGCGIMIVIVAVIIVAVGFLFLGWGGGDAGQDNITITFDEVYASDYGSSTGKTSYYYYVKGYINHFPNDMDGYIIKTIYYDSSGNELTSTTEKLSYFESNKDSKYSATFSSYSTENYLDVDHIAVQIIKDNQVINEFNSTMNKNKLTTINGASPNSTNST